MLRTKFVTALATSAMLASCGGDTADTTSTAPGGPASTENASAVSEAIAAMGLENLDTITYSGTAWRVRNSFRQTYTASPPWPERDTITNYQRTLDLSDPANPVSVASGETFAQNLFLEPPVAGTYTQNIPATQTAWGQQLEIWLTPWGFLKGAELYAATEAQQTVNGDMLTVVSWMTPQSQVSPAGLQYTVTGYINEQNVVERVETRVEDAFMGDMLVAAVYGNYAEYDGVMVPTTMEQQRGGGGVFGVNVSDASANPANAAELLTIAPAAPPAPPPVPPAAPTEISRQLAEGVYLISGGYQALAVEFADHIAVIEAGQSEARGQQILDEVKTLFADKPIRYIVNSHPHSDHTAGLVPFIREGATLVTHENNVAFLDMALSTPRTLLGEDTLMPQLEAATDVHVMEDDTMRVELHHIPNGHSDGTLVAYLPEQRILFQADFTLPVADAMANPFVISLAEYVDTNNLDFDQYLAVHAATTPQTKAELMATIGK